MSTPPNRSNRGISYLIGEAARIAGGVSPTTVRTWEREGLIESQRSPGGYRLFDEEQIARLRKVAYLRKVKKLNTEGIRRALAEEEGATPKNRHRTDIALGPKLRRLRLKQEMTLEQAAEAADLSPSFLSALERDQVGATPASLHRLVKAYGSTLSEISREGTPGIAQFKRRGEHRTVRIHGVVQEQFVDGETIMDAGICTVEPGLGSGGAYAHEGEELVYVLDGVIEISLAIGETYRLHAGDSIYYPSTVAHEWVNPGNEPARLIWVVSPPSY